MSSLPCGWRTHILHMLHILTFRPGESCTTALCRRDPAGQWAGLLFRHHRGHHRAAAWQTQRSMFVRRVHLLMFLGLSPGRAPLGDARALLKQVERLQGAPLCCCSGRRT